MGNWRTIIGAFIVLSALSELLRVIRGYQAGKYESWPFGVSLGVVCVLLLGSFLVKKGLEKKNP